MDRATTTLFRAATIVILMALGVTAAHIDSSLSLLVGGEPEERAELKVVDIALDDARALLARGPRALEATLGIEPGDEVIAVQDRPYVNERIAGAALSAAILRHDAASFIDIDVNRRGRPIRIVVLLHSRA